MIVHFSTIRFPTMLLTVIVWILLWTASLPAQAFFSDLKLAPDTRSKRDRITITLPRGAPRPTISLIEPAAIQVILPKLVALSLPDKIPKKLFFIHRMKADGLSDRVAVALRVDLKEPYLNFSDQWRDGLYTLTIARYPSPVASGPTRILEGLTLPGRDSTLLVISFTGHGWVEKSVDYGTGVAHLVWPEARLDTGWRDIQPAGMASRVSTYGFNNNRVEMEIALKGVASSVHFHRDSEAGTLIVELREKNTLGRAEEIQEILDARRLSADRKQPMPLKSLLPFFIPGEKKLILAGSEVDESYFFEQSKKAERRYDYAKARAYLGNLLELFQETQNRAVITFRRFDLAQSMRWRPGLLLDELSAVLAKFPNYPHYPRYRLLQMELLNQSNQFENALALMTDPNLADDNPRVLITKGKTMMGMERWNDAQKLFRKVADLNPENGDDLEARYLLAHVDHLRGEADKAVRQVSLFTNKEIPFIANHPDWLMTIAEIYFQNKTYDKALHFYATLLENYPKHEKHAPRALLKAAESRRHLGRKEEAIGLYNQLIAEYPDTESALWARFTKALIETDRPVKERLQELDKILQIRPVNSAVMEAYFRKAELLARDMQHREAIQTLNDLITLTAISEPVKRAKDLKHRYLDAGMAHALQTDRPEHAILLAELLGKDWREEPKFSKARVFLAEALFRLGRYEAGLTLLKTENKHAAAPLLRDLAQMLTRGSQLGEASSFREETARVRLSAATRLAMHQSWEEVLILLEKIPEKLLQKDDQEQRLRLLAKANIGRARFSEAETHFKKLLGNQEKIGEGWDYYRYAELLEFWKGSKRARQLFNRIASEAEDSELRALAHLRTAEIAHETGNSTDAASHYQKVSKMAPNTIWSLASEEIAKQLNME